MEPLSFREYSGLLVARVWTDLKAQVKTTALSVLSALPSIFLLEMFAINPAWQTWLRVVAQVAWPLAVLFVYFVLYSVRAAWKIHNETLAAHNGVTTTLKESHATALLAADTDLQHARKRLEQERDAAIDRLGRPLIVLDYHQDAQFSKFQLTNRGAADATSITLGPIIHLEKCLVWRPINRIISGRTVDATDPTRAYVSHPGFTDNNPLAPDGSRHMRALEWLLAGTQVPNGELITAYEFVAPISFTGDEGRKHYETKYRITYDLLTHLVEIAPSSS